MTEQEAMREAFEAWAKLLPSEKLRIPEAGRYEDVVTEGEWRGWQAALAWAAQGQEPVAWMSSRNGFIGKQRTNFDYDVPIYTHPAPDRLREAAKHALAMEQCSLFVDGDHIKKGMLEAAEFLRSVAALAKGA